MFNDADKQREFLVLLQHALRFFIILVSTV
jgi:hypothetical protein